MAHYLAGNNSKGNFPLCMKYINKYKRPAGFRRPLANVLAIDAYYKALYFFPA